MEQFEQTEFTELEQKLKKEAENIEVSSFEEVLKNIKPKLRNKKRVFLTPMVQRITAAAMCLLILVCGLTTYLSITRGNVIDPGGNNPSGGIEGSDDLPYDDTNLTYMVTTKSEVENEPAFNRLNLDILSNDVYGVATNAQTAEPVYYVVQASNVDGDTSREIFLVVYLQPKYKSNEPALDGQKIDIWGVDVTVNALEQAGSPFNNYAIVFSIDNVRYNLGYKTKSPHNDTTDFMRDFITR